MTVRDEAANVASRPEWPDVVVSLNADELRLARLSLRHELNRTEKNIERLRKRLKAEYFPAATEERAQELRALLAKLPRG